MNPFNSSVERSRTLKFLPVLIPIMVLVVSVNGYAFGSPVISETGGHGIISNAALTKGLPGKLNDTIGSKPDELPAFYNDSIKIYTQKKEWHKLYKLNEKMGRYFLLKNNYNESIFYFRKNIGQKNIEDRDSKIFIDEANYWISNNHCLKYQPDSAIFYLKKVLKFREKEYGVSILTAKANSLMAQVYLTNLINKSSAQKYYLKTIKILKEIADSTVVPPYMLIENYLGLIQAYWQAGNLDLSETYGKSALELIYDHKLENTALHKKVLWKLGWIFNNQGNYDKAKDYLLKSLDMAGDGSLMERLSAKAMDLKAIGIAFLGLKRYAEAFTYFSEALRYTLLYSTGHSSYEAVCYYYFGLTYLERYEFGDEKEEEILIKAKDNFEKAENIFHQIEDEGYDQRSRSRNFRRLARTYYFLNEKDSAMKYVQRSLFGDQEFSDYYQNPGLNHFLQSYTYFIALRQKCDFYRVWYLKNPSDKKLSESILSNFLTIDSLVNYHRNDLLIEEAHLYLNKKNLIYYEGALEVLFQQWQSNQTSNFIQEQVFKFMENSKASVLLKSLKQSELYESVGVPDSLLEKMAAIKARLAYLRNQELKEQVVDATAIRAEMLGNTNRLQKLTSFIKQNYLNGMEAEDKVVELASLQDAFDYCKRNKKVVVEYFYGEEAIYGLSINHDKIKFSKTLRTDSLDNAIAEFKEEVMSGIPMNDIAKNCKKFEMKGFLIYEKLIRYLVDNEFYKNVLIVPDGNLSYLPFEALVSRLDSLNSTQYNNLQYLLKDFNISYAFSLSTQLSLPGSPVIERPKVLAFGFSDKEKKPMKGEMGNLKELYGAVDELNSIANIAPGSFYYGADAKESIFKENANKFKIVHLALHNINDYENPLNSKIVFRAEHDSIDDGELHVHELYKINLAAQLVVLSTCESGIGKWNKGEGVYSLGRSLSNLGCSSVIMSLWQVDDKSTAKIMSNLYNNLWGGMSTDKSLRMAKLNYLEQTDGLLAHPSNWAGFVFTGEPTFVKNAVPLLYRYVAIGLLVLLIGLFVAKLRSHS